MTKLVDDAAAKWWEHMKGWGTEPLSEQSMLMQHSVKSQVLPVVIALKPIIEEHAEDAALRKVRDLIDNGHEKGYTSDEILLDLRLSLM